MTIIAGLIFAHDQRARESIGTHPSTDQIIRYYRPVIAELQADYPMKWATSHIKQAWKIARQMNKQTDRLLVANWPINNGWYDASGNFFSLVSSIQYPWLHYQTPLACHYHCFSITTNAGVGSVHYNFAQSGPCQKASKWWAIWHLDALQVSLWT